jgi:hypothetical protein
MKQPMQEINMKLKKSRVKNVFITGVLLSFSLFLAWAQKTIDMTEDVLKLSQPVMFHGIGDKGFAVFDEGGMKIKSFNWDLKCFNQLPLKKGEGPGEAKGAIGSIVWVKDRIYFNCFFDYKIKIFKADGTFEREIPIDFQPRQIVFRKNRLYAFKMNINPNEETYSPGIIMDPVSLKKIGDIRVKANIFDSNVSKEKGFLLGMSSTYDVDENGNIYVLNGMANLFIQVGPNNKLTRKLELPYKERQDMWKDSNNVLNISQLDLYQGIRILKGGIYTCFLKTVKEDKATRTKTYQTIILKITKNGKFVEKTFDGNYVIMGQYQDKLYLFETEEYNVLPVNSNEWNPR